MKTLFEKIIDRELEAEILFENEKIIAIKDKYPKAPVHFLIIPKKMISDFQSIKTEDLPLLQEVAKVAQHLAKEYSLVEGGYRLLVNNGPWAGQTIFHLHFHLLGGRPLGEMG